MNNLLQRVLAGGLCILILAVLLPFAFSPWVAIAIVALFILLGIFAIVEFLALCKKVDLHPPRKVLMIGVALFLLASFFNTYFIGFETLSSLVLAFFIFLIFVLHYKRPHHSLTHIATSTFGLIYIAVPIGLMIQILYQPYIIQDGRLWLIYLIVITKIADIFAFFIGRSFGKKPLSPNLSPKKTVEGFIGGLIASFVVSLLFWYFLQSPHMMMIQLTLVQAIFLGLALPILGMFGDLSESLIKRDVKADDSGRIPGIGGVLDLLDSLLFTAPALYFYLRFINTF